MPTHLLRNQKLKELTFKQVHALAVESLSQHLELKSSGEQSSPEKIWDVLLSAAANNSSIDRECDELEGSPSANTVRGVLKDSLELNQTETQVNEALGRHLKRVYWRKPQKVAVDKRRNPLSWTTQSRLRRSATRVLPNKGRLTSTSSPLLTWCAGIGE